MRSIHVKLDLEGDDNLTAEGVRLGTQNSLNDGDEFTESIQVTLAKPPHTEQADVAAFHRRFGVPMAATPAFLVETAQDFRVKFMQEELKEFVDACAENDMCKAADALVDLAYVCHGTALMMGLPWAPLWAEAQRANMEKVRGTVETSKRGSALDVVKPAGWRGPDHWPALMRASPNAKGNPNGGTMWPVMLEDGTLVDPGIPDSDGGEA